MTPYYERNGITIYHADAFDVLSTLVSVDAVITDPPYVIPAYSNGLKSGGGWGDVLNASFFYHALLTEAKRLTKQSNGAAWVFNSWRGLPALLKAGYMSQWKPESCLVWDKDWIGPGGVQGLRPSYELVVLFCHSQFQLPNRGLPDIWTHPWYSIKPHGHPAEKPITLMTKLIDETPGEVILDPFVGSGTTLVAAKQLGRKAIGIEIEERYCEIAANRLSQEVMDMAL